MLRVKAIATPLTVVFCLCLIGQVTAEEPSLVCTEADEGAIYRLGLDTMHLTPLDVTEWDLPPCAIHYHDGSLYWTDVEALHVASLNGSDYRTLVTFPAGTRSRGVAVDPESGRVFYTLAGDNATIAGDNAAIAVLDLPDYTETVLVSSGLGQPHAIALHPDLRVVFWTDSGASPRIERVDYDGNGRKAIVTTNIASAFGLAVDLHNQLLFWTNSGGEENSRIERSDLQGNGRRVIFSRPAAGSQLAALAFYNNQLFVSDLLTREILLLNATGVLITQVDIPMGRFQDIYVIGTDYTSREAEEPSLVCTEADEGVIYRLGLDTMHLTPLHVTEWDLPPFAIHYHDGRLYWTDVETLHVASLNGSDYRTLVTFPAGTRSRGVAVDPESGRVFYTLAGDNATIAGDNAAIAVLDLPDYTETVLVSSGLGQPHAIALHPDLRVVFWTDSGASPRIERVDYDGNGRKAIVTTNIASAFGLAVDLHNQLLFWTNSGGEENSRIERSDLLGNGRRVIFSRPAAGSQLAALAFYNNQLFVSDLLTREILLLNATGVLITQVDIPMGRFQDIYIISTAHTSPEARLDRPGSGDAGAAVGGAMAALAALAAVAAALWITYSKFRKKSFSVSALESTAKDKVENGNENDHVIPEMLNGPASQTQPLDTRLPAKLPPLVIPAMMGGAGSQIHPLDTRLPARLPPIRR